MISPATPSDLATLEKSEPSKLDLFAVEQKMLQQEQVEIPLNHIFSGGVYIRQIEIPKGALVMGKRHRGETCNVLLKGTLAVYVSENEPPMTITGPLIFTSPPFAKKFAYCLEDAIFLNIIPTTKTDPEEIEMDVIIPEAEYLALKAGEEQKCLSS